LGERHGLSEAAAAAAAAEAAAAEAAALSIVLWIYAAVSDYGKITEIVLADFFSNQRSFLPSHLPFVAEPLRILPLRIFTRIHCYTTLDLQFIRIALGALM
jgi:hypothetical protein